MEKIGQIIEKGSLEQAKPAKILSQQKTEELVIARVWTRMAQIYGHRWVSAYGYVSSEDGKLTGTANTWGHALAIHHINDRDLKRAFRALLTKDGWPPTLPEFINLCKISKPLASYHLAYKALPRVATDADQVAGYIAQMREGRAV